jgi:radical SAM/Cys-rich protein
MMSTAETIGITHEGRSIASGEGFDAYVDQQTGKPLEGLSLETIQVNIGLTCNLACRHCHVESSPKRDEQMDWPTIREVLSAAERAEASTIDITGGAPEMNPHFCAFVDEAIERGFHVSIRTNLTIMLHEGYTEMPRFFADRGVHLIASLPCYLPNNVDKQRGKHVYRDSVEVIQRLNAVGYGSDSDKVLDLVYNPIGPSLPPDQSKLEQAYRDALWNEYGIRFNNLFAITNIPIGRFLHDLKRDGRAEEYQELLRNSFNPATLEGLMCRHQVQVAWDGTMYDCDFNYALNLPVEGDKTHIRDFDPQVLRHRRIATGEHCFGCTAGAGSSCGGALT